MSFKRLVIFLGVSLLLHLIFLMFALYPLELAWRPWRDTTDPFANKPETTLTVITEPAKKQIVDTEQSIPTTTPDKNTPYEGDRNTKAASTKEALGNPNLPNLDAKKIPGHDLYDQTYSPNEPAPPVRPSIEGPPQKDDQQKPTKPNEKVAETKVPEYNVAVNKSGRLKVGDDSDQSANQTPAVRPSSASPARPATFSSSRIASRMDGGAPSDGSSSIATLETEEGRYKAKIYRMIGSRWYQYVHMDSGLLNIGTVRVKFYVRSDGQISDIQVVSGQDNMELVNISQRSIREISGKLDPFSESMKEIMGNGFWDDANFSIY